MLSKDGFIKTFSKPSNPGKAKNFTNPPDISTYFDGSSVVLTGGRHESSLSQKKPTDMAARKYK